LTTEPHYHSKYRDKIIQHDSATTEPLIIYKEFVTKWTQIEKKTCPQIKTQIPWKKQSNMSPPKKKKNCTIKVFSDSKKIKYQAMNLKRQE
jgi:hypothetical protein